MASKTPYTAHPFRLAACVLLPIVLLAACKSEEKPKMNPMTMPVNVEVAPVRVAPLERTLAAVGSLSSPESIAVAPQIGGKIVYLNVEQGQSVQAGAVLARLDDSTLKAQVAAAEAAAANAKQIYDRDQQIAGTGALSSQQMESDAASLRTADANLGQTRANLAYATIRAPFSGTLGIRQVSLGAYVAPGATLVTLQSLDPLYLDLSLPQADLSSTAVGQTVKFKVDGVAGEFSGKVIAVNPALNNDSRSLQVRAAVPNPKFLLKPGMFATVELVTGTDPHAVFIPQQAVVPEGNTRKVWVVGADDQAHLQEISLGVFQNNWVQVLKGLQAGDRVITAGVQKMHPKAKLVIHPYHPVHNPRLDLTNPAELEGGNGA